MIANKSLKLQKFELEMPEEDWPIEFKLLVSVSTHMRPPLQVSIAIQVAPFFLTGTMSKSLGERGKMFVERIARCQPIVSPLPRGQFFGCSSFSAIFSPDFSSMSRFGIPQNP
jgi:hypothetical protein